MLTVKLYIYKEKAMEKKINSKENTSGLALTHKFKGFEADSGKKLLFLMDVVFKDNNEIEKGKKEKKSRKGSSSSVSLIDVKKKSKLKMQNLEANSRYLMNGVMRRKIGKILDMEGVAKNGNINHQKLQIMVDEDYANFKNQFQSLKLIFGQKNSKEMRILNKKLIKEVFKKRGYENTEESSKVDDNGQNSGLDKFTRLEKDFAFCQENILIKEQQKVILAKRLKILTEKRDLKKNAFKEKIKKLEEDASTLSKKKHIFAIMGKSPEIVEKGSLVTFHFI